MRTHSFRRITTAACLAAAVTAAAGLTAGGPAGAASAKHRHHQLSVNAPLNVKLGTGVVSGPNPTTTVPVEINGSPVAPGLDAGQNVIITPKGFAPEALEANVDFPVVFTNLSGKKQRVIFEHEPVDSGTIPPGGTFTWTDKFAIALAYDNTTGWRGKLLMNPSNP